MDKSSDNAVVMLLAMLAERLANNETTTAESPPLSTTSSNGNDQANQLVKAAAKGRWSECSRLLQDGSVNARACTDNGLTPIHAAAYEGHVSVARKLMEQNPPPELDAVDSDGDTPLICAVLKTHENMVKFLVEKGADLSIKNKAGFTAADLALLKQCLSIVKILENKRPCLQFNADLHSNTVQLAAQKGNLDIIEYWLQNHPDKEAICNFRYNQDRTIAFVAALNGRQDILQLLESLNADFEIGDSRGHSPLFCAAQEGDNDIITFLISMGCNVNRQSVTKRTPLFSAINNCHTKAAELLILEGANVNHADEDGTTPIECAVREDQKEIFDLLIEEGAHADVCDNRGDDLVMAAVMTLRLEMIEKLQALGVNLDRENEKSGETALLASCQIGCKEITSYLLNHGCRHSHCNKRGVSPALRAAYNGHFEILKLLGDAKAKLDLPNKIKETAALCAAQQNSLEMVRYLHSQGCKMSAQDDSGKTLAHYAAKAGNFDLLDFLKKVSAPLDLKDKNNRTPLVAAVEAGQADVIPFFLINNCKSEFKKAVEVAQRKGNRNVLLKLQQPAPSVSVRPSSAVRMPRISTNSSSIVQDPSSPLDASFKSWQILPGDSDPIGSGGFGKVYKALTDKYQFVAVKVVTIDDGDSRNLEHAIKCEKQGVELLRKIKHRNILRFLKCERNSQGDFCIFTELISGASLHALMRQQKKGFDNSGIRHFVKQICQGLDHLHNQQPKMLHRDIKCSNIMLTNEGVIKLIDFGLAKEVRSVQDDNYLSRACGTPYFMAPELLQIGSRDVAYSAMSDIWALGCTLYEMCCMVPPNGDCNVFTLLLVIQNRPMPALPSDRGSSLQRFYRRCVEKDADSRATASELLSEEFITAN